MMAEAIATSLRAERARPRHDLPRTPDHDAGVRRALISGVITWILATVIVWFASMIAGILLPMLFLKDAVEQRKR